MSDYTVLKETTSNLHQRDSRSALFEGYTGPGSDQQQRRPVSASPSRVGYGYGLPSSSGPANGTAPGLGVSNGGGYRPATPNKKCVLLKIADAPREHRGGLTASRVS